jgi:hypothetical protein
MNVPTPAPFALSLSKGIESHDGSINDRLKVG